MFYVAFNNLVNAVVSGMVSREAQQLPCLSKIVVQGLTPQTILVFSINNNSCTVTKMGNTHSSPKQEQECHKRYNTRKTTKTQQHENNNATREGKYSQQPQKQPEQGCHKKEAPLPFFTLKYHVSAIALDTPTTTISCCHTVTTTTKRVTDMVASAVGGLV